MRGSSSCEFSIAALFQYRRVYTTALSAVRQHLMQCLRAFDSSQISPVSSAVAKGKRRPVVCSVSECLLGVLVWCDVVLVWCEVVLVWYEVVLVWCEVPVWCEVLLLCDLPRSRAHGDI